MTGRQPEGGPSRRAVSLKGGHHDGRSTRVKTQRQLEGKASRRAVRSSQDAASA